MNEQVGDPLLDLILTSDLPPLVKDWVFNSKDPKAEAWRRWLKQLAIDRIEAARVRQLKLRETALAEEEQKKKGKIRRIAIVDPVINDDFTSRYGLGCWNDPDWVRHTREHAPELFLDNGK